MIFSSIRAKAWASVVEAGPWALGGPWAPESWARAWALVLGQGQDPTLGLRALGPQRAPGLRPRAEDYVIEA